ncbi:GNAT family N-acetyltransferase [Salinibacterium sp. SWN1162]|uniref:GNAT family N-acetyltransferase n=1 Tax=Salinibacterium sp. SWN1162 TaxID=2792053 RepID=UPI0018CCE9EC|nr:GNAT family N-acetyltransferase [Salinibacterium sp. SWN1162]MBH0009383.1 GNAT family N-acetyltransferase [Salinibacterium sp. SWN1162]
MTNDFAHHPVDLTSAASLAASGFQYDLVDTSDRAAFEAWFQADSRGFHGPAMSKEQVDSAFAGVIYRRTVGVWDKQLVAPEMPVATVSSWREQVTVPGSRSIDAWAISSVTVSPTHRRRGIARALLEGELRSAVDMGLPMATLTVSESTIYGRFGFGQAVFAADLTIDTTRAAIPVRERRGVLQHVAPSVFVAEAPTVFERVRLSHPGQIKPWPLLWERIAGTAPGEEDYTKHTRVVRFDDEDGTPRGFVVYRVAGGGLDFSNHKLTVDYLLAETPEAYEALWRFVLEVDLVREVKAELRSVDEPLLWMLSDMRSARVSPIDHLWLRILDVPASLNARTYSSAGQIGFEVSDELDFANGRFVLETDDAGMPTVRAVEDLPEGMPAVSLSVNELSSLYLGGVSVSSLITAGHVVELTPGAGAVVARIFHSATTPWLSVWF